MNIYTIYRRFRYFDEFETLFINNARRLKIIKRFNSRIRLISIFRTREIIYNLIIDEQFTKRRVRDRNKK